MSKIIEYRIMEAVVRDPANPRARELAAAYTSLKFLDSMGRPAVCAVRLPMESEYREYWQLPYDDAVKARLGLSMIQARTILAILRQLTADGRRTLSDIKFVLRDDADAAIESIGGPTTEGIRERAKEIERAIYQLSASLVPPTLEQVDPLILTPYRPFDVIQEVTATWNSTRTTLRPILILDDAHTLHPDQFELIFRDLARREMKIGRWVMMRLDRLAPKTVLGINDINEFPEIKPTRDYLVIRMQTTGPNQRMADRRAFRSLASDMADRYLQLVKSLSDRQVTSFRILLSEAVPTIAPSEAQKLEAAINKDRISLGISHDRTALIAGLVERYSKASKSADINSEVKLMMQRVLMYRYSKRVPQRQFTFDDISDPEPKLPLRPNADVLQAARLYLHREYNRPLHYGLETLCDASQENAELFLHLAGTLVARAELGIIRGSESTLTPKQQQDELRQRATEIIDSWSFPYAKKIQKLVSEFARQCERASDNYNTRLGGGPNAIGIPADEMAAQIQSNSETSLILKYAYAYDALNIVPDYGQGGKTWFLIELSGLVCLRHGLNLKRGYFLERRMSDINSILSEDNA